MIQVLLKKGLFVFVCLAALFYGHAQLVNTDIPVEKDSATLAASLRYKDPSFFKRLFLGKNYRATWAMPVTLPVFHLRQMGFTIKELGGGQQTKSLELLDKNGHEWALRTVDKDVTKAIPAWTRHTIIQRVTQDLVSASNPYAALVVWPLEQATGVIAAKPVYYIVPDDPALGEYRELFKNTMCLLESENPTPDHSAIKNTEELVKALLPNQDTLLNQPAILRARLVDMLVGDWDRHQKQWDWGFEKVGPAMYGYAIPKDRDQALFYTNGLLAKIARVFAMKHTIGFAKNTRKLKQLNTKAWNFDRFFLNELNAADWSKIIQTFATSLPDSVIHDAVHQLPPEVYPLNGALIEKKLISRRNSLWRDALRYYRFIASSVTLVGTDERDRFVINSSRDSITIQQFAGPDFSRQVYRRTFYRNETYQIKMKGLGGADEFIQTGNHASRIRVVIDGGSGANQYQIPHRHKIKFHNSSHNGNSYLEIIKEALRITEEE